VSTADIVQSLGYLATLFVVIERVIQYCRDWNGSPELKIVRELVSNSEGVTRESLKAVRDELMALRTMISRMER
jgi:hypothetical protein